MNSNTKKKLFSFSCSPNQIQALTEEVITDLKRHLISGLSNKLNYDLTFSKDDT